MKAETLKALAFIASGITAAAIIGLLVWRFSIPTETTSVESRATTEVSQPTSIHSRSDAPAQSTSQRAETETPHQQGEQRQGVAGFLATGTDTGIYGTPEAADPTKIYRPKNLTVPEEDQEPVQQAPTSSPVSAPEPQQPEQTPEPSESPRPRIEEIIPAIPAIPGLTKPTPEPSETPEPALQPQPAPEPASEAPASEEDTTPTEQQTPFRLPSFLC